MAVQSTPPPPPQQQQAKPTMTPEQIAIVKSTAPLLKEHGVAITSSFYSAMLAAEPALRNVFNAANQATGAQPRALAALVFAFASHIDDGDGGLAALGQRIRGVAHRHVSLQVQPAQYAIVGHHLIAAVARVLGPELVTPAVADAWIAAYAVLADIFIGVEREMYSENQDRTDPEGNRVWPCPSSAAQGGEAGWRPFRIQRRVNESADAGITSFYLVPVTQDNAGDSQQPLPSFKPGQYISLRIPIPESGGGSYLQPRQYSLSDAPGKDYYRISVKREQGKQPLSPAGLVSNILHERYHDGDVVELTHPMGEFHLTAAAAAAAAAAGENEDESEVGRPLVLISAGVGVTPMISILDSVLGDSSNSSSSSISSSINGHAQQQQQQQNPTRRPVSWIHGAHSASARAFHEHVAHTIASAAARRDGGQEISSHLFLTVSDDSCPTASHAPSSSSDVSSSGKLNIQRQHDYTGRIDLARIPQGEGGLYLDRQHPAAAAAAAEYYICGPRGFMDAARAYLVEEKGVDEARVFRELFGTGS